MPGGEAAGHARGAVQAAEHVEQRGGLRGRGARSGGRRRCKARAAGLEPRTDFNPVLLKPQTDRGSQVVVHGRPVGMLHASDYRAGARSADGRGHGEFRAAGGRVRSGDRGRGPAARRRSTCAPGTSPTWGSRGGRRFRCAWSGTSTAAGVIAAVVGTGAVLDAEDRALIAGFLINKLRGDPALFEDGVRIIERAHTGWPCFGGGSVGAGGAAPAGRGRRVAAACRRRLAGADGVKVAAPVLSRLGELRRRRSVAIGAGRGFRVRAGRQADPA